MSIVIIALKYAVNNCVDLSTNKQHQIFVVAAHGFTTQKIHNVCEFMVNYLIVQRLMPQHSTNGNIASVHVNTGENQKRS